LIFTAAKCLGDKGYEYIKPIYKSSDPELKEDIIVYLTKRKAAEFSSFFDDMRLSLDENAKIKLAEYYGSVGARNAADFMQDELMQTKYHQKEYRYALVRTLAVCGNYNTIAVLNKCRNGMSREADRAIAVIQMRIGAGDSGWLSVQKTEEDDGFLNME